MLIQRLALCFHDNRVSIAEFDIFGPVFRILSVSEVTRILEAAQRGEPSAANELLPLVYHELRRLAAHKMPHEAPAIRYSSRLVSFSSYLV